MLQKILLNFKLDWIHALCFMSIDYHFYVLVEIILDWEIICFFSLRSKLNCIVQQFLCLGGGYKELLMVNLFPIYVCHLSYVFFISFVSCESFCDPNVSFMCPLCLVLLLTSYIYDVSHCVVSLCFCIFVIINFITKNSSLKFSKPKVTTLLSSPISWQKQPEAILSSNSQTLFIPCKKKLKLNWILFVLLLI
jgi:hypothetical protein